MTQPPTAANIIAAADNHNVASGSETFLDKLSEVPGIVKSYTVGAVVSGAHSFYNTGIDLGNWMVGYDKYQRADTYRTLQQYDSAIGSYYLENEDAVNLGGLIAGAIIPGAFVVKGVNIGSRALAASKAGYFGTGVKNATGILPTASESLYAKAAMQIADGTFNSRINRTAFAGLAAGAAENALMVAGTELLVAATMNANPLLENLSVKDHLVNIMWSTAFFTPIFTGIGALKGFTQMRKAGETADRESMPFRYIPEIDPKVPTDEALITLYERKKLFPEIPTEGVSAQRQQQLTRYADQTKLTLDTKILERWQSITGGDIELSRALAAFADEAPIEGIEAALTSLKEARRGATVTATDKKIMSAIKHAFSGEAKKSSKLYLSADGVMYADETSAIVASTNFNKAVVSQEFQGLNLFDLRKPKNAKKYEGFTDDALKVELSEKFDGFVDASGRVTLMRSADELAKRTPEAMIASATEPFDKMFLHIRGPQKGVLSDAPPPVLKLADNLKGKETIEIKGGAVIAGSNSYKMAAVGNEVGIATDSIQAVQARYIYAAEHAPLKKGAVIHESDLPFLERAFFDELSEYKLKFADGTTIQGPTGDELLKFIETKKGEYATAIKGNSYEVAERINTPVEYLEGMVVDSNPIKNLFMWQNEQAALGSTSKAYLRPSYAQLGYDTRAFDLFGNVLEDATVNAQKAQLAKDYNRRVTADFFREDFDLIPDFTAADVMQTTRYSGGQSFLGFAQSDYFSAEAKAQAIGRIFANVQQKKLDAVNDAFTGIGGRLANNQAAAIEVEVLLNKVRGMPDTYVMLPGNQVVLKSKYLHDRKLNQAIEKAQEAKTAKKQGALTADELEEIRISVGEYKIPAYVRDPADVQFTLKHPEAVEFLSTHSGENFRRVKQYNNLQTAKGRGTIDMVEGEIYAPPHNFSRYPHYALVRDKVTGEMSMIGASSAKNLEDIAAKVPKEYQVLYAKNTDEWHKALGDYKWSETITDTSVDIVLKKEGILTDFFPKTDAQSIVVDLINWHKEQTSILARGMMKLHNAEGFGMLEEMSKQYTASAKSVPKTRLGSIVANVDDPYGDLAKTMLNITKATDNRIWMEPQRWLDSAISNTFGRVQQMFTEMRGVDDLAGINQMLRESGYRGPTYDAATALLANHPAPKGVLSEFVRMQNSLATTFMLRLDFLQALNNAVGNNILMSSAFTELLGKMKAHPVAGPAIREMLETKVPGSEVFVMTTAKALAKAQKEIIDDLFTEGSPLVTRYSDLGLLPSHVQQLREAMDPLVARNFETIDAVKKSMGKTVNAILGKGEEAILKGELYTGNTHSEIIGRASAARVAENITDVAVANGLMTPKEAFITINTFVNNVHGATLASQRPIVFQGPVGQAISLFMSYQFNFMQQLFKYVGEGQNKAAAMLLGMQTSIYGVQGLPAFNALNTHIIGNASGNKDHRDIYSEVSTVFGKELGDWLMYGTASNILGVNLFSRGDLNPRQMTILPVMPQDIPFVAISAKAIDSMTTALSKTIGGAPAVDSFLQGVAHAGFNRPLGGLASMLSGYTTTRHGTLLSTTRPEIDSFAALNDVNWLAAAGRLAGGKPFDEAVLLSAHYRYAAYKAKDTSRLKRLGAIIKTKVLSGEEITEDDMLNFMTKYQKAGGRQDGFARYMINTVKDANESAVNQLLNSTGSRAGQYMQRILAGGTGMPDYTNQEY